MDKITADAYLAILRRELVPAMGCTEPIAVAYAGALARRHLGRLPESIDLTVSGNIIKNVKSVIVPNTGGRKGLRAAVCAGIVCGDPDRELEVLSAVTQEGLGELAGYLESVELKLSRSDAATPFDIRVRVRAGDAEAYVRIAGSHTNVVEIKEGGRTVFSKPFEDTVSPPSPEYALLNVEDIVSYADSVDISDVAPMIERQIEFNTAIAQQGLSGRYGAAIGATLLEAYGDSVQNRAKAWAAAGSDARMNGCELPVVINSGSGNQGLTASLPVVVYAGELGVSKEKLYRALVVSNLITIRLKSGIGSLSAYCGATSAGAGAGAGVAYLHGGGVEEVAHTVVNALAINSGMVCDGAKSSCAAKIASAVESGLLGFQMYRHKREFLGGDGIVIKGVENTIDAVSALARDGMKAVDDEILDIMMR